MSVFYGTYTRKVHTTTADLDFVISGLDQVPMAARFTISFSRADGTAQNHLQAGVGITDGTRQYAMCWRARNSRSTSDTSRMSFDNACLTLLGAAGSVNGQAAFSEWIDNESGDYGVRLSVSNAFAHDYYVTVEVWAGVDGAYVGDATSGGAINDIVDITDPGFQPDYVYAFSGFNDFDETADNDLQVSVGHYSNRDSAKQRSMAWYSQDNVGTTVTAGKIDKTYIVRKIDTGEGVGIAVISPDSSGFSIITRIVAEAVNLAYLAIKESTVTFEVGDAVTPTSTGIADFTDPGQTCWMFSTITSHLETIDAIDVSGLGAAFAIGTIDTKLDADGWSYAWADEDAQSTSDTQSKSTSDLISIPADDGSSVYIARFVSAKENGPEINWTAAPGNAKVFIFAVMSAITYDANAAGDTVTTGDATGVRTRARDAAGDTVTTGDATGKRMRIATADGDAVTTGAATGERLRIATAAGPTVTTGDATGERIRSATAAGDAQTGGDATASRVRHTTAAGDTVTTGDATGGSIKDAAAAGGSTTGGTVTGGAIRSRTADSDSMTGGSATASRVRHTTAAGDAVTNGAGTGTESGVKEGNADGPTATTGDATGVRIRARMADGSAITGSSTSGYRKRHTDSDGDAQTGGAATGRRVRVATAGGDAVTTGDATETPGSIKSRSADSDIVTAGSATGGALRRRQAADGIGTATSGIATGHRVKHVLAAGDAVTGSSATGARVTDLPDAAGAAVTGGAAFARVLRRQWSSMNAITQLLLEAVRDDPAMSELRQEMRGDSTEGLTERRIFPPTIDEARNYYEIRGGDLPYLAICTDGGNLIASRTKEMGGETVLTRQLVMILSYDKPTFEMRRYYQRALRNIINAILSNATFQTALWPYGIEARRIVEIGGEDSGQAIRATALYVNVELVIQGTKLGTSV